ncbi:hypothetical protein D3C77_446120 [compost metagenome]
MVRPRLAAGVSASVMPKLAQVSTRSVSSVPVTAPPAATGASLLTMVVVTLPLSPTTRFSKLPPVAELICTLKDSAPSAMPSRRIGTLKVPVLLPFGIVTVATPVKSEPSLAVPV